MTPESTFLFGRDQELTWLREAWALSRTEPVVVYVEGPAASGKTWLLECLADVLREEGTVVVTPARQVTAHPDAIVLYVARSLGEDAATEPSVVRHLSRVAERGPFAWIIEDYDAWRPIDGWFRAEVVRRLDRPMLLVLEAHEPLQRLWSGDLSAQIRTRRLELAPWDDATTAAFLSQRGMPRAWVDLAVRVAVGSPALAARMADAVAADPFVATAGNQERMFSFLVERALHPGSRRLAWRAGFGDESVDGLVAAGSLLPYVTRSLMETMVGRAAVDASWSEFQALPIVRSEGPGLYAVQTGLRTALLPLVLEARPWSAARWLCRAGHYLTSRQERLSDTYVAEAVAQDILALGASLHHAPPLWTWPVAEWKETPTRGAWMRADGTVAAWADWDADDPLRIRGFGWDHEDEAALPRLLTKIAARQVLARRGEWVLTADEREGLPGEWLAALGYEMRRHADGTAVAALDLADGALPRFWARQWFHAAEDVAGPAAVEAVREALTLLQHPQRLINARVAQWWRGPSEPSAGALRRWILDALTSADLGDWPSGRVLLTLYYVERRGSHEALAERLNLSRATYFRSHQRALKRLAESLLGGVLGVEDGTDIDT
jgi:hypothetical protein